MTEAERIHEVEKKLKGWRKLQEKAWAAEEDAAAIAFAQGVGGAVQSSNISDKTYRGAELLAAARPDILWVETIQECLDWMKKERPELFNLLKGHYGMVYMRGYRRKHAKSFMESYRKVYCIGPTSYHDRRKEALREVAAAAVQNGILYVTRSYKHDGIVNNSIRN